ncbi:3'-5' exonuclease [Methylophaga lonarensis]|nr:3'-5' exonuclease [Methylophaga lonarensis]
MAEIIPSLSREVLSRMTSGEKRFASRLRSFLEDDYLCWYDIPLGRHRRYPDFIILHPSRGLLFLEVKDWKASSIKKISKETVELLTNNGLKTVANPFVQVRQYAYQGLRLLEADEALRQQDSRYKGNLVTPFAHGVVFTNITRNQIEAAIAPEYREKLLPDHLVIYKDEMTESVDPEAFQKQLWDMFPYTFHTKLTLPQIDRIRWHLFPEVRIAQPSQENLFDDSPNQASSSEELLTASRQIPDIIRIMDIQQEQLARSLGEGHRVIHGVAGSGKTLILGYRAELLAKITSKPVLVLCFNITLAAKLRSWMEGKGIVDKVNVYHFHDWCNQQLKTYHVDVVPGEEPYWERLVMSVIQGVNSEQIPRAQYSAVLIDEGHDFEADWLRLIVQMLDPETNSLLLLYDDAQSIYQKKSGLSFSLSSTGIQAQGRTTILKLNYRNTQEILAFAYDFAKEYFGTDKADAEIPLIQPEAAGIHGERPSVHFLKKWQDEIDDAISCLKRWHQRGGQWREMAVLYAANYQGKAIAEALKQHGIPHAWLGSKETKKAYNPAYDRVSVLSIHSSKGLEFPAVIMVGISQLKQDDINAEARLLYVGMTRAQKHLHLTVSQKNQLTERILEIAS